MQRGWGGGGKRGGRRPTCLQRCWPEPCKAAEEDVILPERGTVLKIGAEFAKRVRRC
ncbi:hypothetical protein [Xenorhabdus indica]|uniref:hypothetical protein n=1 Tax=Xenorhabdus indica TaxID=333964 RepID=UPI0016569497|nr:hypothetical protein [Xenorhabdus indica]